MTSKEFVLDTMKKYGKAAAEALQVRSADMSGTELNQEKGFVPDFLAAVAKMNMLERPIGFVCRSSAGRVVKLLQPYDSAVFTGEPEELPAQFGFVWSKDPKHALPFVAISTSPFMKGDCCTDEGMVYRSKLDNNTWKPSDFPQGWEVVTEQ